MAERFDDPGLLWLPELFKKADRKASPKDPRPKVLPPIPETSWTPRADFPDLSAARAIAIDTETYDPDLLELGPGSKRGAYIVGVSVAVEGFAAYYPVAHSIGQNLDASVVFAWLRDQLGRPQQAKIGANILYDLEFLDAASIRVAGPVYDVQYADPLIYEYSSGYSLDVIAERRLGERKDTSLLYQWCADAYGGKPDEAQRANIWRAPVSLVGPYAEQDARLPLRILSAQWPLLRARNQVEVYRMECQLIPLLLEMRKRGVRIDETRRQSLEDELSGKIQSLQAQVGLNVYAAADLQKLCEAEGIKYEKTEHGNASFTKKWLSEQTHPRLLQVNTLRLLYKMRDTFIKGALRKMQVAGRVHCLFHPMKGDGYGTVSGRFASSAPNLQQVPARDEYWGPRVRSCFIPDDDLLWGKYDLSQIEYRLGVHFGCGPGIDDIRELYRTDLTVNFYKLAAALTGLPYGESKSLSLGTLYGMGLPKFARMIGKSLNETREIFEQYNAKLPFMRATYDYYSDLTRSRKTEDELGWVRTIGGRRCHLNENFEHKALNRLLQGSCADWIKRAMLNAYEQGIFNCLSLYLTVHDELDVGIPRTREGVEAARALHSIMVGAYSICIPVRSSVSLGRSWGELSDVEPESLGQSLLGDSYATSYAA